MAARQVLWQLQHASLIRDAHEQCKGKEVDVDALMNGDNGYSHSC